MSSARKPSQDHGSYIRKVREGTQQYAQELLAENDRLRLLVATLESEQRRLDEQRNASLDFVREIDSLRGLVSMLERDKLRLQEQLLAAHEELDGHRREQARLQRQVADVERESRRFSEQYVEVEAQNSNLSNLYVASYRLHGTVDRQEVLGIIQEIVANLIGSEELAIYEKADDGSLQLLASFGIEPAQHQNIPAGAGRIGRAVQDGAADIGPGPLEPERPQESELSACIPLKLDGRVTGALALFRLLPQKSGFEAVDHELFDLLATHAATALHCTGLHARLQAMARG
jgi:hypothetical protein